jgi:hypothetical protein
MDFNAMTAEAVLCKRCRSTRIIKSGVLQGNQRYQCKDCGCVFLNNFAPLHGRLPVAVLVSIIEHFFTGMPLDFIRACIERDGFPVSLTGLEKTIYNLSRKAVRITAGLRPELSSLWILEGITLSENRPIFLLDILDSDSGFILASDVISDFVERDSESVYQKALSIAGSPPERLIVGPDLSWIFSNTRCPDTPGAVVLTPRQEANLLGYREAAATRTQLVKRRLNFDSLNNIRLICAAWRVNYNFFSDLKPIGQSAFNSWLDILNALDAK